MLATDASLLPERSKHRPMVRVRGVSVVLPDNPKAGTLSPNPG
jgi:hypothetical protein